MARSEPTRHARSHKLIDPADSTDWQGMEELKTVCSGLVHWQIEALLPNEKELFTPREAARAEELGPKRRKLFVAARVALKRLARQIDVIHKDTPDSGIETLGPDRVKPCLARSDFFCSVSHTDRFVVAAGNTHPVGVDIEAVSAKALRTWRLFMPGKGRDLLSASGMSPERTATRAWTIKEAAAKAFDLGLSEAIREVEIVAVGETESEIRHHGRTYIVKHAEGEAHVLSLMICGGS